jgi:hypothetical protein
MRLTQFCLAVTCCTALVWRARIAEADSAWVSVDIPRTAGRGATLQLENALEVAPPGSKAMRWVYQGVAGDFEIRCRLLPGELRAGIVLSSHEALARDTLTMAVTSASVRLERSGRLIGEQAILPSAQGRVWIRVGLEGGNWTASFSRDGIRWTPVGRKLSRWKGPVLAGLAVWSGAQPTKASVRFEEIGIAGRRAGALERRPFKEVWRIPGSIEVEDFDIGAPGEAYHEIDGEDDDSVAARYRLESVDVVANIGGGRHVRSTRKGEWLEYSVDVGRAALYRARLKVASLCCGGSVYLEAAGSRKTESIHIPTTNSRAEHWTVIESRPFSLESGRQTLRLVIDEESRFCPSSAGSIDALEVVRHYEVQPASAVSKTSSSAGVPSERDSGGALLPAAQFEAVRRRVSRDGYSVVLLDALRARVDQGAKGDLKAYDTDSADKEINLARAALARDAALLYRILGKSEYAEISYRALADMYAQHDEPNLTLDSSSAVAEVELSYLAVIGRSHALAYDWAKLGWSTEQRSFVRAKIVKALDAWPCLGGSGLQEPYQSVIVPTWRGAELLMMLSTGEHTVRYERYSQLKAWLSEHLRNTYGSSGIAVSGVYYTSRAGLSLIPVLLALREAGDGSLESAFSALRPWRALMAAGALGGQKHLQFSTDPGEGHAAASAWASLLLGLTLADDIAPFRWFYDRFTGPLATGPYLAHQESSATPWALLFYPQEAEPVDPDDVMPRALADEGIGAYVLRQRWQDHEDMQVGLSADTRRSAKLGSQDTANGFGLNVMAFGHRFVGGPGPADAAHLFSSLTVDGRAFGSKEDTASIDLFEAKEDGSGYAILDGGLKYRELGVSSAKRHVLVDYSALPGKAIIATLDRMRATQQHRYSWQLNVGGGRRGDDGLLIKDALKGAVPGFSIDATDGAYLQGVVATSPSAAVVADDPVQAISTAADLDMLVVMVVGKGPRVEMRVSGIGLDSSVRVGDATVRYDTHVGRLAVTRAQNDARAK